MTASGGNSGGSGYGADARLKPEEFRLLRDLFCSRIGISFFTEARPILERRLRERMIALNLTSFSDYYEYLRFSPSAAAEWDEAIDLVTTNETYFCREDYQLRAFANELLPLLATQTRTRDGRLSIWSAGCSTGEEVYTIAMLVECSGLFKRENVRIYGSDVSRRCIATARRAVYGPASFRAIDPSFRARFFKDEPDGAHVDPAIRSMCQFGQANILDADRARLLGRADAVFCRNVLIYFDAHARKRAIDVFHDRLHAGGVLLLGHSESLLNVSTAFELLHLKEDLVYRKPKGFAGMAPPPF